ncbi:MAG: hypothetical protein KW802_03240, partial [Candidatus Doudnabacteria bacterium]|nr:hypothetical protein [Candidatus Doudnabacteria bacterium]
AQFIPIPLPTIVVNPVATTVIADGPRVYEKIAIGIARGILEKFTEDFLNRFTNQLVDKYKIRNFLYYDRVLTDYYLNRYIADNITDPDLRNLYSLMDRAYVSGQPTGTTDAPDPSKALIPRINDAISKVYIKRGGIDPQKIYNPSSFSSDREYFPAAQAYFSNPKSFTEQNLQGEFGALQSSATTASQLEILVGNAIKAGRVVGGTCKGGVVVDSYDVGTPLPGTGDPNNPQNKLKADLQTPEGCKKYGGTWQPSAVDQARSFIDNPSIFVQNHLDAAISQHFNNLYNPATDFWTQVGKSFGRFIWNQLGLNKSGGTLPDSPNGYQGNDYGDPNATSSGGTLSQGEIDLDGDGIADAVDYTGDGIADLCSYGGTPPNCVGSIEAINGTPGTGNEIPPPADALSKHPEQTGAVSAAKSQLAGSGETFLGSCGSFKITNLAAWNIGNGAGLLTKPSGHRCEVNGVGYSVDIIAYSDGYIYDVLVGSSDPGTIGANSPSWSPNAAVAPTRYAPPIDPATLSSTTLADF